MSVATPFFDLIYQQRQTLPNELDEIESQLINQLNKLSIRRSRKLTDKRRERIAELEEKIENNYIQRDIITGQLIRANEVVLPEDEFQARLDVENGFGMVYFDITDSPYDDTYTANEPLVARISTEIPNDNGGVQRSSTTVSLANAPDYWQAGVGGTQTFSAGFSNQAALLATLQGGTTAILARQPESFQRPYSLDVLYTQTFNLPII